LKAIFAMQTDVEKILIGREKEGKPDVINGRAMSSMGDCLKVTKGSLEWENRSQDYDFTGFYLCHEWARGSATKNWSFFFFLCKFEQS